MEVSMEALEFLTLHAKKAELPDSPPSIGTIWAALQASSQDLRTALMNKGQIDVVWKTAGEVAAFLAQLADFYEEHNDADAPKKRKRKAVAVA